MTKKTAVFTSCVMARPSFLAGFSRALDVAGTFADFNRSESEEEADRRAIANDWRVVGSELERAVSTR